LIINFPNIIVIDWENAMMGVVAIVFPNATLILCWYHISKNWGQDGEKQTSLTMFILTPHLLIRRHLLTLCMKSQ